MQTIYRRLPLIRCDFNKVALHLYWNRTLAWVFPWKFDAFFQINFSSEHLWRVASVYYCNCCFNYLSICPTSDQCSTSTSPENIKNQRYVSGIGNQRSTDEIRPTNYLFLVRDNKKFHRIHYQYNRVIKCKL